MSPLTASQKAAQDKLIPATASRAWCHGPSWWWTGWRDLLPIRFGGMCSDEYGRRTVVLGWLVTGQVIIVVKTCYCPDCCSSREETNYWREVGMGEGWWEE